ncbi:MAG: CCA tRNA nucleotidyltransferase, partial [Terriglobales bacterium]
HHLRFADAPQMRRSTLKRFLRMPHFDEHLELHRLDCRNSHGDLRLYDFVRQQLGEIPEAEMRPPRLVTGEDLLALGYPPGPRYREILDAVEEAQLEGVLVNREAALRLVAERFPKGC